MGYFVVLVLILYIWLSFKFLEPVLANVMVICAFDHHAILVNFLDHRVDDHTSIIHPRVFVIHAPPFLPVLCAQHIPAITAAAVLGVHLLLVLLVS